MKIKIYSFLFVSIFLFPICSLPVSARECEQILLHPGSAQVPDTFISYSDDTAPEWKKIWDRARSLYRQKKFAQAGTQYELLLTRKENIDQARWEYVSVLMCLSQWQRAEVELGMLTSHHPERIEYQLAGAEIAFRSGDYTSAVQEYASLYHQSTLSGCNEDMVQILTGYIEALEGLGRIEALIPLMEQLIRLRPEDQALQLKLADIAVMNNQPKRAMAVLQELEQTSQDDPAVLERIARVLTVQGKRMEAASYWQQLVGLDRLNREAHEQLIAYYHWQKQPPMELKHVESLLLVMSDDTTLFERAIRLQLALDRPDRALKYCNLLLSMQPDNVMAGQLKQQALYEFAEKLLVLVDNNGHGMLWQDLARVTADYAGVYFAMADMLREQGRRHELIEVLSVINRAIPDNIEISNELSQLLKIQGRDTILASSRDTESRDPVILPQ